MCDIIRLLIMLNLLILDFLALKLQEMCSTVEIARTISIFGKHQINTILLAVLHAQNEITWCTASLQS